MDAVHLDDLRTHLLRDLDRDGFPDALVAPVWIAHGGGPEGVDAGVAAAAELLATLADRALHLKVDTRRWDAPGCGFVIGPRPPSEPPRDTLALGPLAEGFIAYALDPAVLERALIDLLGRAPARPRPGAVARRLGLGALLHGDAGVAGATPYSGARDTPTRFEGGFAPGGGVPESLGVALRLALAGLGAPERVCMSSDLASFRTAVDPTLSAGTWLLRRRSGPEYRCELVGHDPDSLAAACAWFAEGPLATPDGQRLDDIEDVLTTAVRGGSRLGRVAAVASAVRRARAQGHTPVRAELASPPASAPRLLGVPVANSARDGARQRWRLEFPWEGDRLLDAASELLRRSTPLPREGARAGEGGGEGAREGEGRVSLETFASESLSLRLELRERLRSLVERLRLDVTVAPVRHAFRPALHWLLEEVTPGAPRSTARLHVSVERQPERFGPSDRWLRELYPVAELIERQRPGLEVTLELLDREVDAPTYRATLHDAEGATLASHALPLLVSEAPHPAGGIVLVAAAGARLTRGEKTLTAEPMQSDAEVFWSWFSTSVLPAVTADLDVAQEPLLQEMSIVASLSEPDDRLDIDHETDSVLEVLHEEVYFGVLEAVDQACGGGSRRALSVGRILPFFRAAPRSPLRAVVEVRPLGSERAGVVTGEGAFVAATDCDARVCVSALGGRDGHVTSIELELLGEADAVTEARERLRWLAAQPDAPLPSFVDVHLAREGAREALSGPSALRAPHPPLPDRPLHPHEVVRYARALGARHPALRVAAPRESVLGQPLVVIELMDAERPALSRARAAASRPTLLVTARQHANEATSTQAVLRWLDVWLRDPALHRRANLVLHPLANPDGARAHAAFCALAPNHMHHAARYTAFGADLQSNPRSRGSIIAESLMRHDAARRWQPVAHLDDHGYPAHAWIRSLSGFLPRGFENFSLPTGHLSILVTHANDADAAEALRERLLPAIETTLSADAGVSEHTKEQLARSLRYRPAATTPFVYRSDLPFWVEHRPVRLPAASERPIVADGPDRSGPLHALAPLLTLITEVPDETVEGAHWARCVRTHERVDDAVARALLDHLSGG
jgi:hypothetical protein